MGHNLSKSEDEILGLVQRAMDELITAEEVVRLNELVESSDEAVRAMLLSSNLDAEIAFRARLAASGGSSPGLSIGHAEESPKHIRVLRFPLLLAAVAASVIGVAAFILHSTPSSPAAKRVRVPKFETIAAIREPLPVGTLVSQTEAAFLGRARVAGDSITSGSELRLTSGKAQIGMASGADLFLEGECHLRFVSADRVELLDGAMTVDVAKWGTGFVVDTKGMRVTDLGTRFAVDAAGAVSEAHVIAGKVRVQPTATSADGRRSLLLGAGEAIRVDTAQDTTQRLAAANERFTPVNSTVGQFKPIPMDGTGVGLAEGDEDSHWRITDGPEGGLYHGPQYAVVCKLERGYAASEPERSQWISVARDHSPGVLPRASFTFETQFDLTGYDPSSVVLAAQVLADNGVRQVRVNGKPIEFEPWNDTAPLQSFARDHFHLVEIKAPFVGGINRIEFDVWNGEYFQKQLADKPNPMALRVEFQAFGRLSIDGLAGRTHLRRHDAILLTKK